jgi:AmiR/NasT family two-component response regulator
MTHVIAQPIDDVLERASKIVMAQYRTSSDSALLLIALGAVNRGVNVSTVAIEVIADRSLIVRC